MQLELVDLWLRQHSAISHHHHSAQSKPLPQLLRSQQRCAELGGSGCQRRQLRVDGLRDNAVSGGEGLLSLHSQFPLPHGRLFSSFLRRLATHTDRACQCAGVISPNRAQELLPRNAAPSSLDQIADNVKLVGGETIGFMILGHFSHAKVQPDRAANEKHPSRSEWACVAAGLQRGQQVRRT